MSFAANEAINGLYGKVYDENGKEIQGAQEFEAVVEFEKAQIKQAGVLMTGNKVMGASGSGSLKIVKLDTRLQNKIATNPTGKYNFLGKLADPTARGEEGIMLYGVSFDSVQLMSFKLGEVVECDFDFTFDDFKYTKTID